MVQDEKKVLTTSAVAPVQLTFHQTDLRIR
jgi:hypothetical protein